MHICFIILQCVTSHGADFVQVMGGNSFELSANENTGIICGMKSNTGKILQTYQV
jgi:hypothetical protein